MRAFEFHLIYDKSAYFHFLYLYNTFWMYTEHKIFPVDTGPAQFWVGGSVGLGPGFDLGPKNVFFGKHILRTKIAALRFLD